MTFPHCRESGPGKTKAKYRLILCMQFHGIYMAIDTESDTGSNDAQVNKVRAEFLTLRQPVKNQIGCRGKNRKFLRLAEWNVRTLIDRAGSKRPERQTALVAKELSRYDIDIAAIGATLLPLHDSMAENEYTFILL